MYDMITLLMSILIKKNGAQKHALKQVHKKRLKRVGGAGVEVSSAKLQ
jgi:hypothetical protein